MCSSQYECSLSLSDIELVLEDESEGGVSDRLATSGQWLDMDKQVELWHLVSSLMRCTSLMPPPLTTVKPLSKSGVAATVGRKIRWIYN